MSSPNPTRGKSWFFALMSIIWLGATLFLVRELSPRPYQGSKTDLDKLSNYTEILDRQDNLLDESESLFREISTTKFDIYQDYKVEELQERINQMMDSTQSMAEHRIRVGILLDLLLDSREELVVQQRNIEKMENAILNCQEGNKRYLDE